MESEKTLSIGDYLAAVRRRRLLAVGVAVTVLVVGVVLAVALPSVYRATATYRLVTDRIEGSAGDRGQYADEYVFGLAEKVLSRPTLERILHDVDPYPRLGEEEGEKIARLRRDISVAMVTQTVLQPGGRNAVINTGFRVSYDNRTPRKAGQVATELSKEFVELGRSDQLAAASNRESFFAGEVERVSGQITRLEQRLADFKTANFDRLPEAAQANVAIRGRLEQELDGVEREIRTLQQNRIFMAQQLRQAQAGPVAGNIQQLEDEYARKAAVYADNHPDLITLRRRIDSLRRGGTVASGNSLQAQVNQERAILAEARQRYSDEHPDVRRIVRNIELLEARIAAGESETSAGATDTLLSVQLQTQLNAVDTQIGGLQSRGYSLRAKLAQLDEQLGSTPEVEREYQEITRSLGGSREQYDQMISQRMDADVEIAAINSGAADRFVLVAAPSTPSEPAGPPRLGIFVVSVLLAVIAALSAVVAAEVLDPGVRGTRDIREAFRQSPLAVVPEIRNSVRRQRRVRRVAVLVSSVIIGAPLLYYIVHGLAV